MSAVEPTSLPSWDALGAGGDHPIRDFCDTVSVKAAADAYVETGLYAAGYRHLHLDDCWAGTKRNASGHIQPDPARFPGGMKEVVDYVHSKGLTFGLYTSAGKTVCVGGRVGSQDHWSQDAATFAEWQVWLAFPSFSFSAGHNISSKRRCHSGSLSHPIPSRQSITFFLKRRCHSRSTGSKWTGVEEQAMSRAPMLR
eukprot:SAG31_NODE_2719_length_5189_cov_4.394029_3_plen_197_part_00